MRTFLPSITPVLVSIGICLTGLFLLLAFRFTPSTFAGDSDGLDDSTSHFVTIHDQGKKITLKTDANTIAEILDRAHYQVQPTDIVEPALSSTVDSDVYINIYRSRPVVVIDHNIHKYLMTASHDPAMIAAEAGLTLYDGDRVASISNQHFLETGIADAYQITRNGGRTITVKQSIPFATETRLDLSLKSSQSKLIQSGEDGVKVIKYQVKFVDGKEVSRQLISETIQKPPINKIVAQGAPTPSALNVAPLSAAMGRHRYAIGGIIRQETYYDLNMRGVMGNCGGGGYYTVRSDGAKVDRNGYVIVAANLRRYPRCSVVATSLGAGKVYDTGGFAAANPEQFDLATDWSRRDGI